MAEELVIVIGYEVDPAPPKRGSVDAHPEARVYKERAALLPDVPCSGRPRRFERSQALIEGLEGFENQPAQKYRQHAASRPLVDREEFVRVNCHFAHLRLAVRIADRMDGADAQDLDVLQHGVVSLAPLMSVHDLPDFVVQRPCCGDVSIRAFEHGVHDGLLQLPDARTPWPDCRSISRALSRSSNASSDFKISRRRNIGLGCVLLRPHRERLSSAKSSSAWISTSQILS
jgi:hypothetical protein